ncbi:MAG: DUF438 domain-containing protein [Phycisphaerales bacterium]
MSELLENPAERLKTLQSIVERLGAGASPDEVRTDLRRLVRSCDPAEVAAMEQELIRRGVSVEKIMGMCDLHAQLVRETMIESAHPSVPSGHPVDVFLRENAALRATIQALRSALEAGDRAESLERFNELMDIDKHYARKEHLLFTCLERHGITGPSSVMWGKDDEVRAMLAELGRTLTCDEHCPCSARKQAERTFKAIEEMMFKEENILLPMALSHLTASEWGEVHEQSPRFGWCLIDPTGEYQPPSQTSAGRTVGGVGEAEPVAEKASDGRVSLRINTRAAGTTPPSGEGVIMFPTGSLSYEQLAAIFKTMPVDMTFVDADDRVRFFSEGPKRVFVRPKAVIGRKVQFCHPPASVDTVNRILDDFKSGRQSVADFWIVRRGRFVQIRYFAVRDADGKYLGTLEFTQDLTRERALEGERRLLQYD